MLKVLHQEVNRTRTENGAATNRTSGSDCLDLFATVGALRREADNEILVRFIRAYAEDADIAMKLLFFARDIRGGLGERRVFRTIFTWLAKNKPDVVRKNLMFVSEYGRFDDLLSLLNTPCERDMLNLICCQLTADLSSAERGENISLLAKWLPSVNASNEQTVRHAKRIARAMGMKDADYRKTLTKLRAQLQLMENHLRENDYSFDYTKQPSRALYKYRRAFARNDGERYREFLARAVSGEAKLHAENVAPYELVEPYLKMDWFNDNDSNIINITTEEADALNATWASMPDYGGEENAITVIDTSGSMYWDGKPVPAAVALSLGLYFADHNKGHFRNHFIEFSHRPQLIEIKGETFVDKLRYISTFSEVADTNLEAVFDLILDAAVNNNVCQDEMPAKLIIVSDMEFNECITNAEETNFNNAKNKYEAAGYKLPEIIFWNVASRNRQQPVTKNDQGVALVSGVTPGLFSMIAGENFSPYSFMLEVINSERYAKITA